MSGWRRELGKIEGRRSKEIQMIVRGMKVRGIISIRRHCLMPLTVVALTASMVAFRRITSVNGPMARPGGRMPAPYGSPDLRGRGATVRSVSSGFQRSMGHRTRKSREPAGPRAPSKGPRGGLESLPYMGVSGLCRLVSDNVMTHFQCLGG